MGGQSPVEMVVEGLQERSRLKRMEELRRFIRVDNHEPSSIPRMWETVHGSLRSWMRTGMPFVRPLTKVSRKRNGRTCTTSMKSCTKRSNFEKPGFNKNAKALWLMRDAMANREAYHDQSSERHIRTEPQCDKLCGSLRRRWKRNVNVLSN